MLILYVQNRSSDDFDMDFDHKIYRYIGLEVSGKIIKEQQQQKQKNLSHSTR